MSAEPNHVVRAFGLFWGRLGPSRYYLAAIAAGILGLAAIGLWHLLFPVKQTATVPVLKTTPAPSSAVARISPGAALSATNSPAPTSSPAAVELERQVVISDLKQREQRGPRGETFVVATIGLASRANVEKSGVEIHVYFYDLTAGNEMRPTDAQVTYQWLTPVRDWSDPTPKYLAATYFKPPVRQRSVERLRYGGFVVRVLSDGKLQDERSQPESLVAQLRSSAPQQQTPNPSITPVASPTPALAVASPSPQKNIASTNPAPQPTLSPPSANSPTDHSSENLPYGKVVAGKPGFVSSPYDPKFLIDVRGFPPGTLVIDPNTNKPFRVP